MSLIGDALKKAHLEAVRQDGMTTHMVHTPGVPQFRREPRAMKSWMTVLLVSNVIVIAIVSSVVLWGMKREPTNSAPPPEKKTLTAEPIVASAQTDLASQSTSAPDSPGAAQPSTSAIADRSQTETAKPAAPPQTASETKPESTTPTRTPPPLSTTAQKKSRNGFVDGQTYMKSVPVPGGAELILNGISVVGDRGVALINSRMIREGDRIGPFLVGTIGNRRVQLLYDDISIYLRLP